MAAICAYISAVWAGTESPLLIHLVLIPASVLAGISVGAGILLERPKYSANTHRVALWLVMIGVGVESFCTVVLFVVDERISGAQQSKIIALETQIAPRVLAQSQLADLARSLRPFSPSSIIIATGSSDEEADDLAGQIRDAISASGNHPVNMIGRNLSGSLSPGISIDGRNIALVKVTSEMLISVFGQDNINDKAPNAATPWLTYPGGDFPDAKNAAASIFVGAKPLPMIMLHRNAQ